MLRASDGDVWLGCIDLCRDKEVAVKRNHWSLIRLSRHEVGRSFHREWRSGIYHAPVFKTFNDTGKYLIHEYLLIYISVKSVVVALPVSTLSRRFPVVSIWINRFRHSITWVHSVTNIFYGISVQIVPDLPYVVKALLLAT